MKKKVEHVNVVTKVTGCFMCPNYDTIKQTGEDICYEGGDVNNIYKIPSDCPFRKEH